MTTPAQVELIYKITTRKAWASASAQGALTGSPDDVRDGYMHFSTAHQLQVTAQKYYTGIPDLVLVAVAPSQLGSALKWEASRGGDLFPHLYADLPTQSVQWVRPLPLGANGIPRIEPTLNGEHSSHD